MKIEREINGDVAVLSMRGEFDSFVVNSFLEEVESLAANGIRSIVLDMRLVKFIMSTAIGAIVKSRKMMKEFGGDLVIAQPSGFVRDVLDSLGLTKVLQVFDENQDAVKSLGQAATDLPQGNSAMLHFDQAERQKAIGGPAVGRIIDLSDEQMALQVAQAASYFPEGESLKAKFRLPLFKKSYYFEIAATIAGATANEEGARVEVRFDNITADDCKSIQQFINDMNFLRDEVKKAGNE